ncbi:MAG: hypothetical protein HDT38_04690 [Clostridiales bacterium]|nr:hypothetical protein [Clostridiales bacterium]
MKKRWIAILLALLFAAALLPGTAFAAAGDDGPAGSRLTGAEREVYRVLKAEAAKIADGSRSSTVVRVPDQLSLSWTLEELGAKGSDQDTTVAKMKEKAEEALRVERVCNALALDCPYEMFWNGLRYSYSCEYVIHGNRGYVQNLTISFQPAQDCQGDGEYTVSPAQVDKAKMAAENARAIVEKHQDKTDYEKLRAYREEICALASFDGAAAQGDVPYGGPWQLVSVFDGDPDTCAVCEGYAKAFQYLCDLSEFRGDVVCRTVTGQMNGGGHMWNVVQMEDGKNYLVDVTNCDSGAVGAPDRLFLVGGSRSEEGRVYTVSANGYSADYAYGEGQEDLYADGYLALSESGYVPDAAQAGPASDPPKPELTLSGPGGAIPKEDREFTLRNITETFVPDNRHSAIHTDFTRNEETERVSVEDIFTLALGTEVTVDGLRTEDGTGDVWDVVSLYAWSDPDGDGVYSQRLFTYIWEYTWVENNFTVVSTSNPGPFTFREIDYGGHMPIYDLSINVCGHDSLTSLWRGAENMAFPSSVTLSAEYLTKLFGPNTLIRFEVSTYGADEIYPSKASEISSFYGYIPEGQAVAPPAFTDVPSWFEVEVAWAAQKGITNGYGGSTTFAPNVECPHIQILTFLWRAADKPASSAKCPTHVASYYQEAANWAYEKGLIDGTFDPDAPCTRADAVSYIWQALDSPEAGEAASFSDVDMAAPYAGAVSWAVEKGVTKGYGGSDTFAPDRVCTRGEIAAFLYRAYH